MKDKSGFLLINKKEGITSHDVVEKLRKITGIKKIGHAGTLDPSAKGLLILGIGRKATKNLSFFLKKDKEYLAKIKLGAVSDTFDREGKIISLEKVKKPSRQRVEKALKSFQGEIQQYPPLFSAKKLKGKKLYQLARKGIKPKIKPQKVKIHKIELLNYQWPYLEIRVNCSSGTYIRSLANDIGQKLKCGGYLIDLCRTRIGKFILKKAANLSEINHQNWQKYLFQPKN